MNIVALGDLIMWGQGHGEATKFTQIVAAALAGDGSNTLTNMAHSGATIGPTERDELSPFWGEVPATGPSILSQLRHIPASVDPAKVDLVLLNGGINDVAAYRIAVVIPFDLNAHARLRARIDATFGQLFPDLLQRTVAQFPNATLVVPSYYSIVSEKTDPKQLAWMIKQQLPPENLPEVVDRMLEDVVDDGVELLINAERSLIAAQSVFFDRESKRLVREAIAQFGAGRTVFAEVPWSDDKAFAAECTSLWDGSNDDQHTARVLRYEQNVVVWPPWTPIASIGHPNVAGAQAYAKAILDALPQLVAATGN